MKVINRLNFKKFCGLAQEVLLNSFFPKCLKIWSYEQFLRMPT